MKEVPDERGGLPCRARVVALLVVTSTVPSACVPVATVRRYGIEARLVDAAGGEPVRSTDVTVIIDEQVFERRSDRQGRIRVSADREWHWSWLGGPAWMSDPEAVLDIVAAGFGPQRILWSRYPRADEPDQEMQRVFEDDGVIRLGTVSLDIPAE